MTDYVTIVVRVPEREVKREELHGLLKQLAPYQTGMSCEDEMTLLDCIQRHTEYPDWISDEARASVARLHALAEQRDLG